MQGTIKHDIWFKHCLEWELIGYYDSEWVGSVDDLKSIWSSSCFNYGMRVFWWGSGKEKCVAQSTIGDEYIAAASAVNQTIWLTRILEDLGDEQRLPLKILCDNCKGLQKTLKSNKSKLVI